MFANIVWPPKLAIIPPVYVFMMQIIDRNYISGHSLAKLANIPQDNCFGKHTPLQPWGAWIAQQALSSKTEFMQMMILTNSEADFFWSAPVFMHHVSEMDHDDGVKLLDKPVDFLVFSFTTSGIASIISEKLQKPLTGFVLQPTCIPSSDPKWTAVQAFIPHWDV